MLSYESEDSNEELIRAMFASNSIIRVKSQTSETDNETSFGVKKRYVLLSTLS